MAKSESLQVTMRKLLGKLGRFSWTIHNIVGHPVSEVLFQLRLRKAGAWVHDNTMPDQDPF